MSVLKSDEQLETGEVWGHKRLGEVWGHKKLVLSHAVNCMVGDEGWHETGLMTISRRLHSGSVCVCDHVSGFPDAEGDGNCLTTREWTALCISSELPRKMNFELCTLNLKHCSPG